MKVIVSAGGTGGHLYPALALADYIKTQDKNAEFLFVGTTDRLESQVVPTLGYNYRGLDVKGLVGNPIQKGINALKFLKSLSHSRKILKEFQPDIVVGFGGYPSASIVLAAAQKGIKTVIHEQNSVIGLTNKILINKVDRIVCCYERAYDSFPKDKTYLLGNPRATVVAGETHSNVHDMYHIDPNRRVVVIVMGSLGSASVNKVMIDSLKDLQDEDFDVIYVTGKAHYQAMKEALGEVSSSIHLLEYIHDMPSVLASCDLVVSRAGATTLAEITALGCPSLLIPSPYVVANHQEYNASELVNKNAVIMMKEASLTAELFSDEVKQLMDDTTKLAVLRDNAKKLGKVNACKDIYQLMKDLLKGE